MTSAPAFVRRTFAAFAIHNFRLYFGGQVVSVSGAWMQRVAQSWLMLELTDSGTAVGALTAVQFLPLLLLAPAGGLLADRFDKRRVLYATQTAAALVALTLGLLVVTDTIEIWMVFVLALALGLVGSVDNPTRNSFVMEMVGRSHLSNAVALNSVLINVARVVGPALGGVLIVSVGIGVCFLINAASYLIFIVALAAMRSDDIERAEPEDRQGGQLREALRYVRGDHTLWTILVMSAVVGLFSHEFEVVLPIFARFGFEGEADALGSMFASMGVGAIFGGLFVANRSRVTNKVMLVSIFALAASIGATALTPNLLLANLSMVFVGATITAFLTSTNSVLQLRSDSRLRGRVLGLRATAVLGARPFGAPIVGWIGEQYGPRVALGVGSLAALLVGLWAVRRFSVGGSVSPNSPG